MDIVDTVPVTTSLRSVVLLSTIVLFAFFQLIVRITRTVRLPFIDFEEDKNLGTENDKWKRREQRFLENAGQVLQAGYDKVDSHSSEAY